MIRGRPCAWIALLLAGFYACGETREQMLARAQAYRDAGNLEAMRGAYESILAHHPHDVEAIAGMIQAASRANATEDYVRWSRELLRVRPWDLEANLAVARWELDRGRRKEATARLMMALQDADFAQDKQRILILLGKIHQQEIQRLLEIKETSHGLPLPPDEPARGG